MTPFNRVQMLLSTVQIASFSVHLQTYAHRNHHRHHSTWTFHSWHIGKANKGREYTLILCCSLFICRHLFFYCWYSESLNVNNLLHMNNTLFTYWIRSVIPGEAGSGPREPDLAVVSLIIAGELDQTTFKGSFQPKWSYDSMIYLHVFHPTTCWLRLISVRLTAGANLSGFLQH